MVGFDNTPWSISSLAVISINCGPRNDMVFIFFNLSLTNGVAENLAYMKRILIETKCCQVVTEEVVMESFIPVAVF
jgi:hypothetical protein